MRFRPVRALVLCIVAFGCGGANGDKFAPVAVSGVTIAPSSTSVLVGQSAQLTATPVDGASNKLTNRVVTWSSNNTAVATVSANGLAQGVSLGVATISAECEGRVGHADVQVIKPPVATVVVQPGASMLEVGQMSLLTAVPKDAAGVPLTDRTVTWISENQAVATVSSTGLVTALKAGNATITATADGKAGSAAFTVTNPVAPVALVTVAPASASVQVGQTQSLTATLKDASDNSLSGRAVTWSSTNTAIASVSSAGVVTGVAVGSASITATAEGKSGAINVTVTAAPPSVATVVVSPSSASLLTGQTQQLSAETKDASGNTLAGRTISWSSSNSGVASVSSGGLVSAVTAGSATVVATSEGKTATAAITVTVVASVTVAPVSTTLQVGATQQLTATPKDVNGGTLSGRTITWSSANASIASVSATGLVTAVASGTVTITATSEGKFGTATITVPTSTVAGWQAVGANGYAACGLKSSGSLFCWGTGWLGNGVYSRSDVPVAVNGGSVWLSMSVGYSVTCAIKTDRKTYCWGKSYNGELGNGTTNGATLGEPTEVLGGLRWRMVGVGELFACGVSSADEVWCWGSNNVGQLGDATQTDRTVPTRASLMAEAVDSIMVGATGVCAKTKTAKLVCWGKYDEGTNSQMAAQPPGGSSYTWRSVSLVGWHVMCGISTASVAYCWGYNDLGVAGVGSTSGVVQFPTRLPFDNFARFSTGLTLHACGMDVAGIAKCWGSNKFGQLGTGDRVSQSIPVLVSTTIRFSSIATGEGNYGAGNRDFTCGLATGGTTNDIYCWGQGADGQLGDGRGVASNVPVKVKEP